MSSTHSSCQETQNAIFIQLDTDAVSVSPEDPRSASRIIFPQEVSLHLGDCAMCQRYEAELRQTIAGLQDLDTLGDMQVSGLAETPEGLADRVWSRLLTETDLGQLEQHQAPQVTTLIAKVRTPKKWWNQPVAPMAAAAVLVVLAGWSFTEKQGGASHILNTVQPAYVSADYELDGSKITYDSQDSILDPTWIGSGDANGDQDAEAPVSRTPTQISQAPSAKTSSLTPEADNDPLTSIVGF